MLMVSASAQKLWTLQECIDYAMENNITLQKSKLQKSTATETLKGSKAALLPTVTASTNEGSTVADIQCFDEPDPGLPALEGYGDGVCQQRYGEHEGG